MSPLGTDGAGQTTGYADLHAHILVGVDDGPATIDDSLQLLSRLASIGVTTVAATSHVSTAYPNGSDDLRAAHRRVVDAAESGGLSLSIVRGAEVDMGMAMTLPDDELGALCLGGTRWLLLETPHSRYPAGLPDLVDDLRSRGFEVLIAHPERNTYVQKNPDLLATAVAAGALGQVTGASLRGALGRATLATARHLVETGLAHIVASDTHNVGSRPPDSDQAAEAVRGRFGSAAVDVLFRHAPLAIVEGASAPQVKALSRATPRPRRRRLWSRR